MSQILMHWRQNSRCAMSSFFDHSRTTMMVCGDLKSRTLTAICCSSGVLVHERRFKLGSGAAGSMRPYTIAFPLVSAEPVVQWWDRGQTEEPLPALLQCYDAARAHPVPSATCRNPV